jgi:DNA-binding MarR family transcriptional regulator
VLDHLDAKQQTTLSKLAEHMGVGVSAMSITVSRLERSGYISRTRNRDDRRCVGLTLTSSGSKIKEQNTILDPELVNEMFGLMRAKDVDASLDGLEMFAKYFMASSLRRGSSPEQIGEVVSCRAKNWQQFSDPRSGRFGNAQSRPDGAGDPFRDAVHFFL